MYDGCQSSICGISSVRIICEISHLPFSRFIYKVLEILIGYIYCVILTGDIPIIPFWIFTLKISFPHLIVTLNNQLIKNSTRISDNLIAANLVKILFNISFVQPWNKTRSIRKLSIFFSRVSWPKNSFWWFCLIYY